MPAFRFFDPWSALENHDRPITRAKVAKAAKTESAGTDTLARLATLAAASVEAEFFEAPPTWGKTEEERAAISEHDGGLPGVWAEGLARLDPDRPPADIPVHRWQRFINDVGLFLDCWAACASALGWGPYDLFGCDRDRPFARIDQAGLLWLLNGKKLVALSEDAAGIETCTGERHATVAIRPNRAGCWRGSWDDCLSLVRPGLHTATDGRLWSAFLPPVMPARFSCCSARMDAFGTRRGTPKLGGDPEPASGNMRVGQGRGRNAVAS